MEIAEFLLARVAEDEEGANAALRESSYGWSDNAFTEAVELAEGEGAVEVATQHIARWDPARVLAECDAKRRIVGHHQRHPDPLGDPLGDLCSVCSEVGPDAQGWPCRTLKLLALPYADHPDYREEWKD